MRTGRNNRAASIPSAMPLSVSLSTRTAPAVQFTHVPVTEISCPTKKSRKFLEMCIEANVFRISSAKRDMHPAYEARQRCKGTTSHAGQWREIRRLDEEAHGRIAHLRDRGRGTDRLLETVQQVLPLQTEQVHRHLAGDQSDAEVLRGLDQLIRLGHLTVVRQLLEHRGA